MQSMGDPVLQLSGIRAGYGGGDILKGLDLEVWQGWLACIVGPNGAGKSTLLKVISGLIKPRLGEVTFCGREITRLSSRKRLKAGICQIPQARSLFPGMTVRENLEMGGLLLADKNLVRRRRRELEERLPMLAERARARAGSLSGGQQRLLEIARGLMLDPSLLILDEPSAGLEPRIARQIYDALRALHQEGRTVLLVEQNARLGLRLATHGVVLEGGRVRLEGGGKSVLDNPEIGELFLGGRPRLKTSVGEAGDRA
jgi:ABC-type branched-subunit amino acid transport system ATPase component